MSEVRRLLLDTADRLFADLAEKPDAPLKDVWAPIEEAAFPSLLIGEDDGGFGGDWQDCVAVLRLAGYHALPAPLGEAIIGQWLSAGAGFAAAEGVASVAPAASGALSGDRFTGELKAVPWGRDASVVVAALDGRLIRLARAEARDLRHGKNPAGEARDTLRFEGARADVAPLTRAPFAYGALARTAQIAGALDAALSRTIDYANERVQFGKPIGKFQAVQQALAVFAEEAAAVNCATEAAGRAANWDAAEFEIGAAKLRAHGAAALGAATAHQVHGAIGFTHEFWLHRWTRRLTAWSSEFGSELYWAKIVGAQAAALGGDGLWPEMTKRSDQFIRDDKAS